MAEINRSLAIIIGIDQYTHIRKLKNAVSDADALAKVLRDTHKYDKVLLLKDDEANKEGFEKLVTNLKNKTIQFGNEQIQVVNKDRVLFYFAGHGLASKAQESDDGKPAGYFMPQDAKDENKDTWLSMKYLYEVFTALGCHHLLMILDCCFAGTITWVGNGRNAGRSRKLYQQSYERFIKNRTQQIITSAAHDEEAQDVSRFPQRGKKENGHSPFAYHLLNVLRGNSDNPDERKSIETIVDDKVITVQELFTYLQNQLAKEKTEQTPGLLQSRTEKDGQYVLLKGEYIFITGDFNPQNLEKLKLDEKTNPYKGLASFEKEDSQLFFGRKRLIEEPKEGLLTKVSNHPLTVVLGTSGSGKSSLVKAGLISALKLAEESGKQKWFILAPMRPGESPLNALNKILTKPGSASSTILSLSNQEKNQVICNKIDDLISPDSKLLLLLVIDQAEELFTLCQNAEERKDFINLLAQLLNSYQQRLRIVLTLRSEFEPQIRDAIKENHWQKAWQDGRFIVTPMNREELQQAIEEPAAQRALFFESPKLVNDLIDEVVQMPGALPLLSFTLSELYLKYLNKRKADPEGKDDRTITETDYKEIGGVTRSLTQTADKTYDNLVKKEEKEEKEEKVDQSTIRDVMLRMVAISGGELARRRVPTSELKYPGEKAKQADEVIKRFVEARLLVKGLDTEGQEYVEPVHDALIIGWAKIKYWLDEKEEIVKQVNGWNPIKNLLTASLGKVSLPLTSKENSGKSDRPEAEKQLKVNLPLQREVNTSANNWLNKKNTDGNKKAVGFLWDGDPRLPQLEQIKQSKDNWFNQTEAQFVEGSIVQRRRNIAWIVIWVSLAFLGVLGFTAFVWYQLQLSQLREKAARAENLLSTDPVEGLVLAIDTIGQNRSTFIVNREILPEVKSALLSAVQTSRERYHFNQPNQSAQSTSNQQGQPENNQQEQQGSQVSAVAVSPDGKTFASADKSGNVYMWDLQGKHNRLPLVNDERYFGFNSLSFSPDGRFLIASGNKKIDSSDQEVQEVKIWDLQQKKLIQPFGSDSSNIIAAAFSPDGKMIVSGGKDGTIRLWDLKGNQISQNPEIKDPKIKSPEIKSPEIESDNPQVPQTPHIHAVAFSPDGKSIVSADSNRDVRLWKLQGGKILESPTSIGKCNHPSGQAIPRSVAFSLNSQQIICNQKPDYSESGLDNESFVTLWNLDSDDNKWKTLALKGGNSGFLSKVLFASFSPDFNTIVTGDQDGSIRLWGYDSTMRKNEMKPIGQPLLGHSSNVESVAFSSDGKKIISGSNDGSIRLWDVEQNLSEQRISRHRGKRSAILSPDGQKVAISSEIIPFQELSKLKGPVTLLDIVAGKEIGQFSVGTKMQEESGGDPLAVSSKGYVVVVDESNNNESESRLTLWHPGGTPERQPIGSPKTNGQKVAISPESQRIVSNLVDKGGSENSIQLWDIQGKPIGQPVKNYQDFSVESIAFSPDGQQIVSGSTNGSLNSASSQSSVCLFDLQVNGLNKKLCNPILGQLGTVAFSSDNKTVAIGQDDGGLYLWNSQTNQIGQRFGGNEQPILSIAFSPDKKTIASGNRDSSVRLWNLDGTPIGGAFQTYTNPGNAVSSIAFNRDGKTVIVAYTDGSVRFWQTTEDASLRVACNRLHDHPILKAPNTEVAQGAKETCEKYVWNLTQQPGQNGESSIGDKILVPTLTNFNKQAGVNAISNGDFATAIKHLQAYLKNTPNDPEALIYLNNASIGNKKSYTIAIPAPISSDVNGALEMLRGVAQAQNKINQAGGINQVPLRVLIADDDNKPDTAKKIAEELVKNPDIIGVVGHYASDVTLAAGEVYQAGKLAAISPVSTSIKLTGFGNYIFRTVPSNSMAAKALADYMRSQLRKKNAAVFYNSKSDYSKSLKLEFAKFLH